MPTHRAVAATAKGVLEQVDLPTPKPAHGEVLIELAYAVLIAFDAYQLDREYNVPTYSHVLSIGSSGYVKTVDQGVTDLKEGDKVFAYNVLASRNRALQDYTLVPRIQVAKMTY
ncbi:chaperonin 10-like protein [Cytidiella melzeri]|nr:chaperonin 10-like protein [Cytidiella melzeri]